MVPEGFGGNRECQLDTPLLTSDDLVVSVVLTTGVVGEPVGNGGEEGVRAGMVLGPLLLVVASVAARASGRMAGGLTIWRAGFMLAVLVCSLVPMMGLAAVGSHLVRWTTLVVG